MLPIFWNIKLFSFYLCASILKKKTGRVKKIICTVKNCKNPEMPYSTKTMKNHLERVHKIEFKKGASTSMQSVLSPVIVDQNTLILSLPWHLAHPQLLYEFSKFLLQNALRKLNHSYKPLNLKKCCKDCH